MEKTDSAVSKNRIYTGAIIAVAIISVGAGIFLLRDDFESLLRWYIAFFALGFASIPLSMALFGKMGKNGYYFGKALGLAVCAYVQWLLCSFGMGRFSAISSIIVIVIYAAICYVSAFLIYKKRSDTDKDDKSTESLFTKLFGGLAIEDIIIREAIFFFIIVAFSWLFGHKIPATETERVMDFAFMQTLYKSDVMPPLDLWAAGDTLNYYYFGLYLITYLCKISFVDTATGYSLGMSLVITCGLIFSYSLVHGLLVHKTAVNKKAPVIGGLIASAAVCLCGNMHYFVFYKIVPMLWDILRISGEKPTYWFANSTRYIGYVPMNDADRTISEMPAYSFIIGDLHAHVVDIMYVLTFMALLVCFAFKPANKSGKDGRVMWDEIFDIRLIAASFILAISAMTNYWDYPIYYVVALVIICASMLYRYGAHVKTFSNIALQAVLFIVFAIIIKLPFELGFDRMINGIKLATQHSLVHQIVIMWGLPLFTLIVFTSYIYINRKKGIATIADTIALLLGACATGLVLLPELVFVADIYINGFPRCNTMFKLTYQAFIIFGLMMAYYITRVLFGTDDTYQADGTADIKLYAKNAYIKRLMCVSLVLLTITFGYFFTSSSMWYGKSFKDWHYMGLDSMSTVKSNLGDELAAVEWINDNTEGQEVILTAYGNSYSMDCVIPVLTGHPTVLGWGTHEWLWHNDYAYISDRQAEIDAVYSTGSVDAAKSVIDEYDIRYIYVGTRENDKYPEMDMDRLYSLGDVVYRNDDISSVIIKVK